MADAVKDAAVKAEGAAKGVLSKIKDAAESVIEKAEAEVKAVVGAVEGEALKLVYMFRDPSIYPAPHTAEVHPYEVGNMQAGGWITEAQARAAAQAREGAAKSAEAPAQDAPKA